MFDAIVDVLSGIWDLMTALSQFLLDTVKGIATLAFELTKLPKLFSDVFNNGLLPSVVTYAFVTCLTLMTILRIVGRDG